MQRKFVQKNVYNAGKGKANQELVYLHMSNHYRRILNAKKVIDNSPPHCFKSKRPATSTAGPPRSLNRPLDSPALTDRSVSSNSYKGSGWGTDSYPGSSRYHTNCVPNDAGKSPPKRSAGLDMELIDRIAFDTKNGPATYGDEDWAREKCPPVRKMYQPVFHPKNSKAIPSPANQKSRPPPKASEELPQKQKFIQKKLESEEAGKGKKSFGPKERKTEAVSKLRSLRVYHPPRRKKTRAKAENRSDPMESSNCECTKICVCDAGECPFKKTPPTAKEQSQTSSRDSAYNGGFSSLPESRSPTPDHRRKKNCCCCCCEKKQGEFPCLPPVPVGTPRTPRLPSGPPVPRSKAQQREDTFKKMKEDALYVKFVQDITVEVLEKNLYTNKALKKVMKKHLKNNLHKLNKERMVQEVENLRIQLGIPEDKALLDVDADAEDVSADALKPYPIISDSEFSMPKNLTAGKEAAAAAAAPSKVPKSVSEVGPWFQSETDEEEMISVIQMRKMLAEKRKEGGGGAPGAGFARGHSSDDSDRPSDPKKRSTGHGVKQKLMRTYSSSSTESDMSGKYLRNGQEKMEEESASEEACRGGFGRKCSCLSLDRKNRNVSFWSKADVKGLSCSGGDNRKG